VTVAFKRDKSTEKRKRGKGRRNNGTNERINRTNERTNGLRFGYVYRIFCPTALGSARRADEPGFADFSDRSVSSELTARVPTSRIVYIRSLDNPRHPTPCARSLRGMARCRSLSDACRPRDSNPLAEVCESLLSRRIILPSQKSISRGSYARSTRSRLSAHVDKSRR